MNPLQRWLDRHRIVELVLWVICFYPIALLAVYLGPYLAQWHSLWICIPSALLILLAGGFGLAWWMDTWEP